MKIKMDFVSNSSSTSFIYISDKVFNEDSFYKAAGVDKSSPLFEFFNELYLSLDRAIHDGKEITDVGEVSSDGDYPDFTPEVVQKVHDAINAGKTVIQGGFSSDEDLPESILCTEIFEIDSEDFYINAYDNYW